jgi:hypothetical protein
VSAPLLSDGLSDSLFLLLACSALALAVWAVRGSKPWQFALAGVFCGLAYLTRPEGVVLLAATLAALVAMQFVRAQRRSLRQLLACGASMTGIAVAVGSPYFLTTHSVSNKPSITQMRGKDLSSLNEIPAEAPVRQASLVSRPPLLACTFAIALDFHQAFSRRAIQAIRALASELVKSFHYVACIPALVGMWWYRSRIWVVPGMWVVLMFCAACTLGLWWLAVEVGYLSDRHLMLMVICGSYAATAAVWDLPSRWAAWRLGRSWVEVESAPNVSSRHATAMAVVLLCCLLVVGLPKSLQTLHSNRAGHHAAGLWLAEHAALGDIIDDDHFWAHYYAGRVFQELHPSALPPGFVPTRYVVVGRRDKEYTPTWNSPRPPDEAKIRQEGGTIVYHWPAPISPKDAPIVVYAVPPTPPPSDDRKD